MKKDYKFLIEIDNKTKLVTLTLIDENNNNVKLTMKLKSFKWHFNVDGVSYNRKIEIDFIDEVAKMLDEEHKILEDWFERHK